VLDSLILHLRPYLFKCQMGKPFTARMWERRWWERPLLTYM